MIIKTNPEHSNFKIKQINTKSPKKRILYKLQYFMVVAGMVITMTGCSNTNTNQLQDMQEWYKEESEQYVKMYEDGTLSKQQIESVGMHFAPIDEDFLNNLPQDLKKLELHRENFIKDLSNLPTTCPNLETLVVEETWGITDWSFIKDFKNLKSFKIHCEAIGITDELIDYLNKHNIEHNLTKDLVEINNQFNKIYNSIITEDMTDDDKLDALTYYVINNMDYDKDALSDDEKAIEYNEKPFTYALKGQGVCTNYSALINGLCSKANITSYVVTNEEHAWNLVKLEGKYYYIDATSICQIPIVSKLLLKHFGIGFFYKQSPYHTGLSKMDDIDELKIAGPSEQLLKIIKEAEDEKGFIEKFGSNAYVDLLAIVGIASSLGIAIHLTKKRRY